MQIKSVTDKSFRKYGKIVDCVDFKNLIEALKNSTPMPKGVAYEPSVDALEAVPEYDEIKNKLYGEMPIQIGYCNGQNHLLNAVEYHRDSEINVAATDAVLILGMLQDVNDDLTYDTSKMEAFLIPEGCAVELYSTTLHYAPAMSEDKDFRVGVILPKGTNYPLNEKHGEGEDKIITAVNKWLIGHPDADLPAGTWLGLVGENLSI